MFLSTGLKRVRLLGMGTHFFPKNLARGMLIRVGTFIRDTIVVVSHLCSLTLESAKRNYKCIAIWQYLVKAFAATKAY